MRLDVRLVQATVLATVCSLATGEPLPPQFTLGRYIPNDAFMFVNKAKNPERAWVEQQWTRVYDALLNSGVDRDIASLIYSLADDADRPALQARIETGIALLKAVHWRDLVEHEFAFAERITTALPGSEYAMLTRGNPQTIDANFSGLVAIFKELASLTNAPQVSQRGARGAELWSLALGKKEHPQWAINIDLFKKGDVIALVIGSKLTGEILSLMAGDMPAHSILSSRRFHSAMAQVRPPADAVIYTDVGLALRQAALSMKAASAKVSEREDRALRMIDKLVALCNVIEYAVTTNSTSGRRLRVQTVTRIRPGGMNSPLARAFLDRKPFEPFDRHVPADAIAFSLNPLFNLQQVYDAVLDFIRTEITGGQKEIARWNEFLSSVGFDPHRDLFSWLSGEMISVTTPSCVTNPLRCNDSVHMIRVRNPELVRQKLDTAVNFLKTRLTASGQMLIVSPADVKAKGFRTITHPAVAMYVAPVVGVSGEWLYIGTSASAINKCLDVAAGREPSIRSCSRFRQQALIPNGPVRSASFSDKSDLGQRLSGVAAIIGTVGGMAAAGMPDDHPDSRKLKQLLRSLLAVVMKLRPALQMIDFYDCESSVTTFDGVTLREDRVVNFKGLISGEAPQTVNAPCRVRH